MLQRTTRQTYDKYKESRKKANKIIHSKKKAHLKKEIENIELLSNQNDSRKFYQAVKKNKRQKKFSILLLKLRLNHLHYLRLKHQ
jgi:hypothetical protein